MLLSTVSRIASFIAVAVWLTGCGFGDNTLPRVTKKITVSTDYLPFYTKTSSGLGNDRIYPATAFYAVSPQHPGIPPVQIDSTQNDVQKIIPRARLKTGEYHADEFLVHAFRETGLLYTRAGRFFMTSFDNRMGMDMSMAPMAMPVSAEMDADTLCAQMIAYHYPEQHHTLYFYQKPAVNGVCAASSAWYVIMVSDASDMAPRVLPTGITQLVAPIYDNKDASVRGLLVVKDGRLQLLNVEFIMGDAPGVQPSLSDVTYADGTTAVEVKNFASRLRRTPDKRYWLEIDGYFFQYNGESNRLVADVPAAGAALKLDATDCNLGRVLEAESGTWCAWYADKHAMLLRVIHYTSSVDSNGVKTYLVDNSKIYQIKDSDAFAKAGPPVVEKVSAIGGVWLFDKGFIYLDGGWDDANSKLVTQSWDVGAQAQTLLSLPLTEAEKLGAGDHFYDVHVSGNAVYAEVVVAGNYRLVRKEIGAPTLAKDYGATSHIAALVYGHVYDPVRNSNDLKTLVVERIVNGEKSYQANLAAVDALSGNELYSLGTLRNKEISTVNYDIVARNDGLLSTGVWDAVAKAFTPTGLYFFDATIQGSLQAIPTDGQNSQCRFPINFPLNGFNSKQECEDD
ncbi:MAG: hypothetical protein OEW08_13390 [Gammaproteobacteria bacterium]|nr:hypothetical protein [Gammaproteobacteria bacterium]